LLSSCGDMVMGEVGGISGRVIRKEVKVKAALEKVRSAWTTNEGAVKFFAPKAIIELTPGGRYEMYFLLEAPKGSRGREDCRVLSFLPMEMLSFEWSAPPEFPNVRKEQMKKHTWIVVQFYPIERDQTKVRLTHLGWREGEEWEKVFQYFMCAWDIVLGRRTFVLNREANQLEKPIPPS